MLLLVAIAVRPWGKAIVLRSKVRFVNHDQVIKKFGVRMTSHLIIIRMIFYHAECLLNISDGLHFVGWCISGQTDSTDRS